MALTLALAACGGGADTAAPVAGQALDACARLDKGRLGALLGGQVVSAELGAVNDASNGGDLFSQCAYAFADGRMVVLGTGEAHGGDEGDLAKRFRDQIAQAAAPAVEVDGVGRIALWSDTLHGLYVFPGGKPYLIVTVMGLSGDRKAFDNARSRDDAIRVARAVGA